MLFAAAGHRDVRRGGAGGVAEGDVGAVDGLALGSVDGGGVGELDEPRGVLRRDHPVASAAVEDQAAVLADAGDGPGLAVATPRSGSLRRVATRSPSPIRSPRAVDHRIGRSPVAGSARRWSRIAALRSATCSRVSATTRSPAGARLGERGGALDVAGVDDDLTAAMQRVEDRGGVVAGAHRR